MPTNACLPAARRIDQSVAQHMEDEGLELLQFAFRWVNCLMIREIPFHLGMRLWDTYLAEGPRMKDFLMYVCAAFLLTWQQELHHMDFQASLGTVQRVWHGAAPSTCSAWAVCSAPASQL